MARKDKNPYAVALGRKGGRGWPRQSSEYDPGGTQRECSECRFGTVGQSEGRKSLQNPKREAIQFMAEQRKTLSLLGSDVEVADVPIKSATEMFNEYTLEDGSVLKVKNVANSIVRVVGQTLPDGSPLFLVFTTPVVNVISSPKKK